MIDAGFLNAVETMLAALWADSLITSDHAGGLTAVKYSTANGTMRGMFTLATPFHLTTNPTVTSGSTTTLTCTGGATGVPSAAVAVLIGGGISSGTIGAYTTIAPHGATLGQYGGQVATLGGTALAEFSPFIATLSGGQLDVHANSGNIVLQDWYIIAYFI